MKYNNLWGRDWIHYAILAVLLLQTAISAFYNIRIFLVMLAFTVVIIAIAIFHGVHKQSYLRKLLSGISSSLDTSGSEVLTSFPIPVMVTSASGQILWYNDSFRVALLDDGDAYGKTLSDIVNAEAQELLKSSRQADVAFNDRLFSVYASESHISGVTQYIYYFIDETKLRRTAEEYALARPAVAIVAIDNLDELTANARDSEKASISGTIELIIENWMSSTTGILRKLSNDRFMLVIEERYLRRMIDAKFDVLDQVRQLDLNGRGNATLSIGVGRGGTTLHQCEELARQALDMALGRGGDQVAVKNRNSEYQFFGGVSKAVEKRAKVRARVVASALKELIEGSDQVIIMGHRYADLDCFGSAYGLWKAIHDMGKEVSVVMDKGKSMALPLLERIEAHGVTGVVSDGTELIPRIDRRTLLIVVDTHRSGFLDNEAVYRACKTVVVIDHHRKAVDYIDNAVIFYHETSASSTCEMVAELLQYMNEKSVGNIEADALLSGIMLDTRNYVLHTGVRTFEASAFLRNRGADPVEVKKLFSNSMPAYRQRANIVAAAELYGDCAISENRVNDETTRIATAQAADELLNISGVNASFVLCKAGEEINISARSLGAINVQLIMEQLGGGGHRTMAACQLKMEDFGEAKITLIKAIDDYKHSLAPPPSAAKEQG